MEQNVAFSGQTQEDGAPALGSLRPLLHADFAIGCSHSRCQIGPFHCKGVGKVSKKNRPNVSVRMVNSKLHQTNVEFGKRALLEEGSFRKVHVLERF